MKNYKVGDKAWNIKDKCIDTIKQIMYESYVLESDTRFIVKEQDLHPTADSMFEELGYEKKSNVKGILLTYRNNADIIIDFDLIEKSYAVYYYEGDNLIYAEINTQLHAAIHQKLIELGWIE